MSWQAIRSQVFRYLLGIAVHHFDTSLFLSQAKYSKDSLHKTNMLECASNHTSLALKSPSSATDDETLINATEYRTLVGSLQYLTFTRSNITHPVNQVSQKFQAPT